MTWLPSGSAYERPASSPASALAIETCRGLPRSDHPAGTAVLQRGAELRQHVLHLAGKLGGAEVLIGGTAACRQGPDEGAIVRRHHVGIHGHDRPVAVLVRRHIGRFLSPVPGNLKVIRAAGGRDVLDPSARGCLYGHRT